MLKAPDDRRTVPVRLTDVALDVRLEAARKACRYEHAEEERQALLLAALFPSNTTYWIARSAA